MDADPLSYGNVVTWQISMFKNDGLKNIRPCNKHGHMQDRNHGIHMKAV
jgi:hypothetical protein